MAGIYIHVPFCVKACFYCDFHFSTSLANKSKLVSSIIKEIELRKDYLENETIETIYFGGGTPSLLSQNELFSIINALAKNFKIASHAEITLEANPDDIDTKKLLEFKQSAINRLSIGVQSFVQEHLKWMNRAHNSMQAINCIIMAQDAGFENLNIDLIYGFNQLDESQWRKNLATFFQLNIPHLSAYSLTIEEKTALSSFIKSGKEPKLKDYHALQHFRILTEQMLLNGYEHYEISNFAKPGKYSKHNTSYWFGKKYLGIGPSAHSFNGLERNWNIANNAIYIKKIEQNELPQETEVLTKADRFNEKIMVSLRTQWGLDLEEIKTTFGSDFYKAFENEMQAHLKNENVHLQHNRLFLTTKGKEIADLVASDLFWVG